MGIKNQTEKEIETAILRVLEAHRIFAWKNNSTAIYDPVRKVFRKSKNKYAINGVSDILGVFNGQFLAIEVKRPCNKERPEHQQNFIDLINKNGGIAFFATSIDEVRDRLGLCKIAA